LKDSLIISLVRDSIQRKQQGINFWFRYWK